MMRLPHVLGDAGAFWIGMACFVLATLFYFWERGRLYFKREPS